MALKGVGGCRQTLTGPCLLHTAHPEVLVATFSPASPPPKPGLFHRAAQVRALKPQSERVVHLKQCYDSYSSKRASTQIMSPVSPKPSGGSRLVLIKNPNFCGLGSVTGPPFLPPQSLCASWGALTGPVLTTLTWATLSLTSSWGALGRPPSPGPSVVTAATSHTSLDGCPLTSPFQTLMTGRHFLTQWLLWEAESPSQGVKWRGLTTFHWAHGRRDSRF